MKIEFLERGGYKAAQRLKKIVTDKLNKLDKYCDEKASAKVVCRKENKVEKLEITVKIKGFLYRSEVAGGNMYENIDLALPKLEKQIVRSIEKKASKKKASRRTAIPSYEYIEEAPEALPEVYKKKTFDLVPMPIDEARYAIERLGHSFYAFLNARTGRVNILYRRTDGKFGLIDLKY